MRRQFNLLLRTVLVLLSFVASADEPIVRMLVPGFTVQELPLKISNINNLRFAPDGTLTALGYDGRVHLLRDTNGDGLEDSDELFWDKTTITVPVGMVWSTNGLYVSSQGKVSLLRDTNGDGKADEEEIIASGWPPTDVGSGGVDATSVTLDQEGNLYFGLLTADYSNPYRVKDGVSRYDINGLRGTIQKWNVKTKKLETIATGIRVPYTLAFNRAGDLFNTDQEGETWCPNGNPLDELNHIILGKNYGFPPRDEKWLPNLISEPPVVAFGPQHQSTCGLVFNEPTVAAFARTWRTETKTIFALKKTNHALASTATQGLFGPKWWEGDALVAGESRGKIWRVKLVKTPHGYIGKEFLIARLSMLTMDLAISPKGDLYVCCHSGKPDWGTGPKGDGKIFKISYTDKSAPQPVATWAAEQSEVRVAFDRPVDSTITNGLAGKEIEFGEFVSAADRYEVLKPPYKVVGMQEQTARAKLKIFSAKLDGDNQTLVLSTAPHPLAVKYAFTIPSVKAKGTDGAGATVDLSYDLGGTTVSLFEETFLHSLPFGRELTKATGSEPYDSLWSGWFPCPDFQVANALNFSPDNFAKTRKIFNNGSGSVYLVATRLNLPVGASRLYLQAEKFFAAELSGNRFPANSASSGFAITLDVDEKTRAGLLRMVSTNGAVSVTLSYSTKTDSTQRAVTPAHLFVPWSTAYEPQLASVANPELVGGDFQRGKNLFFGEKLKCATCHVIRGEGKIIAPDLSNLASRDAGSILRDIKEPSATINPDYVAFNVFLKNGEDLTGFVRAQKEDSLTVLGVDGKETVVAQKDVKELRASAVSLMPTGLLDGLKESEVRDLLTFLSSEPPKRKREEVERVLGGAQASLPASSGGILAASPKDTGLGSPSNPQAEKPALRALKIVWVAGKQDHGPGEHDYPAAQKMWVSLLNKSPEISATNAWEWPSLEQFENATVLVFYFWNHNWSAERLKQLDEFLERGGGAVVLHSATISDNDPERLAETIGLASKSGRSKYLHTPLQLKFFQTNAITENFPKEISFLDEPYWPLMGDTNKVTVLATVKMEESDWPEVWTFEKGKGRVFGSVLGHYTWTHEDPFYRILIMRGIAWAAGEGNFRFPISD